MAHKSITRTDGKLSKQAILEATLIIILDRGIREVKYKTVAELAGVTQSAVAYYFSGIPLLIESAFRFYFDKYTKEMVYIREVGNYVLANFADDELATLKGREQFIAAYSDALIKLFGTDYPELRTYLLLDRIFRNETLTNKSLYRILKVQDQNDIDAIIALFAELDVAQPEQRATHFMSLLWFLSERLLQENYQGKEVNIAKSSIESMLRCILLQ